MRSILGIPIVLFLVFILAVAFAGADLKDGLVAYWPLDGDGDDLAGNSEGELDGGADWVNEGRLNGAVQLDGATGHVACSAIKLYCAI